LPDDLTPEVGMALQSSSPEGEVALFTVVAVTDETFTVDGNHPLAGQVLSFNIELVAIS
jgi:FKBP-type peptidyl-prolyl cis-trans isomerase 2